MFTCYFTKVYLNLRSADSHQGIDSNKTPSNSCLMVLSINPNSNVDSAGTANPTKQNYCSAHKNHKSKEPL